MKIRKMGRLALAIDIHKISNFVFLLPIYNNVVRRLKRQKYLIRNKVSKKNCKRLNILFHLPHSNACIYSSRLSSGITIQGYPPAANITFMRNLPIRPVLYVGQPLFMFFCQPFKSYNYQLLLLCKSQPIWLYHDQLFLSKDYQQTEKTRNMSDGPGSRQLLSVLFNLTVTPDIENLTGHIPCQAGLNITVNCA